MLLALVAVAVVWGVGEVGVEDWEMGMGDANWDDEALLLRRLPRLIPPRGV